MIGWLKAAGETSRLRLLALCSERAMSVSDLAQALSQSEPRVSRHLKILCEAGLIERQRQGQWVHYRLGPGADAASFVAGLLAQLDRRDRLLMQDRSAARAGGGAPVLAESRLGRALAAFALAAAPPQPAGRALLVGLRWPELIERAAQAAKESVALARSRRQAQAARTFIERQGLRCRVLEAKGGEGLSAEDLARAGSPFDLILLAQPAAGAEVLASSLSLAAGALAAGGQLWLFEGYEALESSGQRVVEHPLARLRRLLSEARLHCARLSPLEADGEHVLAAIAAPAAARAAGVA